MSLAQRVALVTGASGGIGSAIAVHLAGRGAGIVIHYRHNVEAAERTQQRVAEAGGEATLVQADITTAEACRRLIEEGGGWKGRIDILVNNAGLTRDGLLIRMRDEDWHEIMAINLHATFYCTRAAVREMLRQRWGRVVNISSIGGKIFTPMVLSLPAACCSSANACLGSRAVTSRAAATIHCRSFALRLCHSLSLIQTIALLASCSLMESTGATS